MNPSRRGWLIGIAAVLAISTAVVCTLPPGRISPSAASQAPAQTPPRTEAGPAPSVGAIKAVDLLAEAQRGDIHARARLCADEMLAGEQTGNFRDAAYWCALAAEAGDAKSQTAYARLHQLGAGVAQDDVLAAQWYEKAVAREEPHALYMRGRMLMAGFDVADQLRGQAMVQRAADLGHPGARWALQRSQGVVPEEDRKRTRNLLR